MCVQAPCLMREPRGSVHLASWAHLTGLISPWRLGLSFFGVPWYFTLSPVPSLVTAPEIFFDIFYYHR